MKLPKIDWVDVFEWVYVILILLISVALPIAIILALLKVAGVIG